MSVKVMTKLDAIYKNPSNPGSYRSVRDLYIAAKAADLPVTFKAIEEYLKGQKGYAVHSRVKKKFPRDKTVAYGFMELIQCELADLKSLQRKNRGYRYVLLVVDVLSKRIWLKAAKNKLSTTIAGLMREIIEKEMPAAPRRLQSDQGTEFMGDPFQRVMKEHNIVHFFSSSKDTKASVAEVSIREVKRRIYRMITTTGSESYVDKLDEIEEGHNARIHPATGYAPRDVNAKNASVVFRKLFPSVMKGYEKSPWRPSPVVKNQLKVGDAVTVVKNFDQFRHGYLPAWNSEVYQVSAAFPQHRPPRYRLSQGGEEILGLWYREELQKVSPEYAGHSEKTIDEDQEKGSQEAKVIEAIRA